MMNAERIQATIHKLEVDDAGTRWVNYVAIMLAVAALAVWYDTHCYLNFSAPEAMDAAQVARNLAEGEGFTTKFIRPFDIYLLGKYHHAPAAFQISGTNVLDYAQVYGPHPDLANAPLYPAILAGWLKLTSPEWQVETHEPFWSDSGRFVRYKPEFGIAIFNQMLFLVVVWLTFLVAKTIFDVPAAWLAAVLMLGSDQLWKFSISGLPVMLLLVILLGLVWCLASFEIVGRAENPDQRRRFMLAAAAGLLAGLGMLTRYSFGWVIVPVIIFFVLFGGARRTGLAIVAALAFAVTVSPWIARNFVVSGTPFGTAGYAVAEDTVGFPGSRLMQSLSPDITLIHWIMQYLIKLHTNLRLLLQNGVPRLGDGWMGILFLAGLLLGLRKPVASRLRYFTMMCLGVFLIVSALGRTQWSTLAPEMNTENLLVLLTPLAVIFGVAFLLTMLDQMNVPSLPVRYIVLGLVVVLVRLPFALTLLPPKISPSAFPPYFPPEIQRFSAWMQPNELVMSDIPWAVAWYGDRQCTWTTINSRYEFSQLNDYVKPVNALYLTANTLDAKLFSECLQGGADSWSAFVFERIAVDKIKKQPTDTWFRTTFNTHLTDVPQNFPLQFAPSDTTAGLFLTDRIRWPVEQ